MATTEVAAAVVTDTSAADAEDAAYPCKGCSLILEEGKAFELAGNRWHIDCFRCNTCNTLLDSDANLLLLGDGSLICNNCTYSCSACGNKIEDLAILTGDQAFCANCFKCRNCKRKIENLRYARTSQGIFCMQCHESLMARRRKKTKALAKASPSNSTTSGGPAVLDKSLPALPAATPPRRPMSPAEDSLASDTPRDLSPVARPLRSRRTGSHRKELLMNGMEDSQGMRGLFTKGDDETKLTTTPDSLTLTGSVYSDSRRSLNSSQPEPSQSPDDEDGFLVPIALDPSPALPPLSPSRRGLVGAEAITMGGLNASFGVREPAHTGFHDDFKDLVAGSARSASRDRNAMRSPHIAYQELGRSPSTDLLESNFTRKDSDSDATMSRPTSPVVVGGVQEGPVPERSSFRLQDPPKPRPAGPRTNSKNSVILGSLNMAMADEGRNDGDATAVTAHSDSSATSDPSLVPKRKSSARRSPLAGSSNNAESSEEIQRRARAESLTKAGARKEVAKAINGDVVTELKKPHRRNASNSSPLILDHFTSGFGRGTTFAPDGLPARNSSRQPALVTEEDIPAAARAPVPPTAFGHHRINDSISSIQSEGHFHIRENISPLPPHNASGDLSMEEEMGRIMRGEEVNNPPGQGLFRRVSKAVKHGRSHSDKINIGSPKWPRSARNGSIDNSPSLQSPNLGDDPAQMRNQLRYAQQRITELEAERSVLQDRVNGTVEIRQVNTELREKRSTMAFLDTQRELVVRELEVMTEHLHKAKDSNAPLDMGSLQSGALKDFTLSMHRLKDSLSGQIEDLMHKKNELTAEVLNLIQTKEMNIQEFENLNAKNAQLAELNNQLVHNIQELYKHTKHPNAASIPGLTSPPPSGLGITPNQGRDMSFDGRSATSADNSISQLSGVTEVDRESNVSIAAKAQPAKKFNWKKGAKNVSKGFKGAFGNTQSSSLREEQFTEGVPYGSLPMNESTGNLNISLPARGGGPEPRSQTWNFLSAQRAAQQSGKLGQTLQTTGSQSSVVALPAESAVFGSSLARRCSFEKRVVPSIVTRCIAEVESRGMLVEGIYRKSGSSSQVKAIQAGFERDHVTPGYDIADPDLDIHAVTSVLKQYLRRLPTPLITWEVYDGLLEAATVECMGDDERAAGIRTCVAKLPHAHRDTLELLVEHLVRVMEREAENLMTPTNLAVVFAPTIMRPESVEREMSDIQAQRQAVQCLLELSDKVFGEGEGDE